MCAARWQPPIKVTAIGAHPGRNYWDNSADPTGAQMFRVVMVDKGSYVCNDSLVMSPLWMHFVNFLLLGCQLTA